MRRTSIGASGALVALAATLVGCATISPTPCDKTDRNHRIQVAAVVSCKDPHVSIEKKNVITWYSAANTNLQIVFDPPTPFRELTCSFPNECKSGPIDPNVKYGSYKYRAFLDGTEIDPNVIIDK